jgi:hypothetical protein
MVPPRIDLEPIAGLQVTITWTGLSHVDPSSRLLMVRRSRLVAGQTLSFPALKSARVSAQNLS